MSVYFPSASVVPTDGCPTLTTHSDSIGAKTTSAPSSGSPSKVIVPDTGAVGNSPPPQPARKTKNNRKRFFIVTRIATFDNLWKEGWQGQKSPRPPQGN